MISAKARSAFQGYLSNMVLKDILPDFQEFHRNRRIVPERYIPYYVLWVRKFLVFANRKNAGESEHVVQEFVAGISVEASLDTRTLRRP
jgi:hypothetical protein